MGGPRGQAGAGRVGAASVTYTTYRGRILRRHSQQAAHAGRARTAPELSYWDVVEFELPRPVGGCTHGLGVVVQSARDEVEVEALQEEGAGTWVVCASAASPVRLRASAVRRVLAAEYGQRQDTEGNPHGEHAHDVWTLTERMPGTVLRLPILQVP